LAARIGRFVARIAHRNDEKTNGFVAAFFMFVNCHRAPFDRRLNDETITTAVYAFKAARATR